MICDLCHGRREVPASIHDGVAERWRMIPCPDCIGGFQSCCDGAVGCAGDVPGETETETCG
jgi:hypothetical protein